MIGCIGWGSLIWDSRNLDVDGDWRADGPMLHVEFARQSSDGRITLVLVQGFAPVPTLWCAFDTSDLGQKREGVFRSRANDFIARWSRDENPESGPAATISAWGAVNNLDAAVWTNLPPKFDGIDGRVPTENEVVAYFQSLDDQARAAAEKYVRRAPRQIATVYWRAIERALGLDSLRVRQAPAGPALSGHHPKMDGHRSFANHARQKLPDRQRNFTSQGANIGALLVEVRLSQSRKLLGSFRYRICGCLSVTIS